MFIPKYRAKEIDSDKYVKGFLINPTKDLFYIIKENSGYLTPELELAFIDSEFTEIDPSTLAICTREKDVFEVFEALNSNGRGGDILVVKDLDFLGGETEKTSEVVAILHNGWDICIDYESTNGVLVVEVKGIKE